MDRYHIWCDLNRSSDDLAFVEALHGLLDTLRADGSIEGWHVERRKLGLGPSELGEFHVVVEVQDLAQLQVAYDALTPREGAMEKAHAKVWSKVTNLKFALYRNFPDANRRG